MKKAFLITVISIFITLFSLYIIMMKKQKSFLEKNRNKENSMTTEKNYRQSFFAGSFYPQEANELSEKIDFFLEKTEKKTEKGKPRILLVPHAGIDYSGRVAAWGFKQVVDEKYSRVFLLGASHRFFFDYAAVYPEGIWETPLGKVEVDGNTVKKIVNGKNILFNKTPHEQEHSLEVEIIFLQKVLKDFKIIPILVSQTNGQLINDLSEKIAENFDEETLLVISSDLSHYPSYEIANQVDRQTIDGILSGNATFFEEIIEKTEKENYSNLDTAACGKEAIKVGLSVAEILKIENFKLLKYENSGDVSGEKTRVVGYAAIGGYAEVLKNKEEGFYILNKEEQIKALELARKTLEKLFDPEKKIEFPKDAVFGEKYGVFVTLRKNGHLRGCIGVFEPEKPLSEVIQEMTIEAATNDPRFFPVSKEELKNIKIEISVLSPKRKIDNWEKIKLGKHGVVVQRGLRSGTFLPQVATETGWNLEEFLSQLCSQKAGLPPDCFKDPQTNLYVFEAQVFEEDN